MTENSVPGPRTSATRFMYERLAGSRARHHYKLPNGQGSCITPPLTDRRQDNQHQYNGQGWFSFVESTARTSKAHLMMPLTTGERIVGTLKRLSDALKDLLYSRIS